MNHVSEYMTENVVVYEEYASLEEATWDISETGTDYIFLKDDDGKLTDFVFDMQIVGALAKGLGISEPLSKVADKRIVPIEPDTPALDALSKMIEQKLPVSFVLDDKEKLHGGFCFMNALAACANAALCPPSVSSSPAASILGFAKKDFPTINPGNTLIEACQEIAESMFSCLIIPGEGGLEGALIEKDIAKAVAFGEDLGATTVREYMREDFDAIDAKTPVMDAVKRLNEAYANKFSRHIAVTENDRVAGVANPLTIFMR